MVKYSNNNVNFHYFFKFFLTISFSVAWFSFIYSSSQLWIFASLYYFFLYLSLSPSLFLCCFSPTVFALFFSFSVSVILLKGPSICESNPSGGIDKKLLHVRHSTLHDQHVYSTIFIGDEKTMNKEIWRKNCEIITVRTGKIPVRDLKQKHNQII